MRTIHVTYVYLWKDERDRNERDPCYGSDGHRERECSEVERTSYKVFMIYHSEGDRDSWIKVNRVSRIVSAADHRIYKAQLSRWR